MPEAASSLIRFRQVRKSYGAVNVLDNLDLDIAEGEKVAIIGPSGSGKTTILRLLMTLERYEQASGRGVPNPLFYYCFGLFKIAVIIQQIVDEPMNQLLMPKLRSRRNNPAKHFEKLFVR
jgi:energy-coupling factor transporter ATP-binding protein EcfA2